MAIDAAALVAAFVLARPRLTVLGLLLANVAVSGAVSVLLARRGLSRVVAPVPQEAVVVSRFPIGRLLGSALTAGVVVVLSVTGTVSAAVLGAGVGAKLALLWSAKSIARFERDDGRQVLCVTRRRRGEPALYAAAAA